MARAAVRRRWRALLSQAFRRYFVNTVFDATFVVMGIVVAASLAPGTDVRAVLTTMVAATTAMGISTGASVYEAEKVEVEIRLRELERAMLTELADTEAERVLELSRYVVVTVNVLAPLVVLALMAAPLLLTSSLTYQGIPVAYLSVAVAMVIIFGVGSYLGRLAGTPPWRKGVRMLAIGMGAFGVVWLIQSLLG